MINNFLHQIKTLKAPIENLNKTFEYLKYLVSIYYKDQITADKKGLTGNCSDDHVLTCFGLFKCSCLPWILDVKGLDIAYLLVLFQLTHCLVGCVLLALFLSVCLSSPVLCYVKD